MSEPRRVTESQLGYIHEVGPLYDRFGNRTEDPALAHTATIHLLDGSWVQYDADAIQIHTVH